MLRGRRRAATVVTGALVAALTVPLVAASPIVVGATGGTRYVDAVFAGALAPVEEVSYDPSVPLNSRHTLTVFAVSGTYTLTYRGATTAPIARAATAGQVQTALQALATVDHDGSPGADVTVTGGVGGGSGGRHYKVTFTDVLTPGDAYGRLTATDVTLAGGQDKVVVRCDRCGDVYRPDEGSPPAGGRPVVLLLHGGGFAGGAKDAASGEITGTRMQSWASALAERGYVAVPVNYTVEDPIDLPFAICDWDAVAAPACPQVWQDALTTARYDAQAAVRWLRWSAAPVESGGLGNPYGIDPDRIVVAGESAGAMAALGVLYRSDDPGTVGVTGPSSEVAAGVSVAGLAVDAWQDPGEGPALLLSFTNDPMAEIWGTDFYEENREIVARARAVGNVADSYAWCTSYDQGTDGIGDPVHLIDLARPEWAEQVDLTSRFIFERVVSTPGVGLGASLLGTSRVTPFTATSGQMLMGDHEPMVGDYDGDGVDDVLWYGPGTECDTIWWGNTDGTFTDPDEVTATGYAPALQITVSGTPVVGDFDGDGADDVFIGEEPEPGDYHVLTTGGSRAFTATVVEGLGYDVTYHGGDFDADGHDDMLLFCPCGGALVGYGGSTADGFQALEIFSLPLGGAASIGDVDGDGHDDVVAIGPSGTAVAYGRARPEATAFDVHQLPSPTQGTPVVLDADGDGRDDLFAHRPGGSSPLSYGSSTRGTLVSGRSWVIAAPLVPMPGDVDGDGLGDLVWSNPTTGSLVTWFGTTARLFLPFLPMASPSTRPGWLPAAVELDGVASRTDVLLFPS